MIEQADERLKNWVQGILQTTVSLSPPSNAQTEQGVSLYLLDLLRVPPTGNTRRSPLQLILRYLVTTWAAEPEQAHHLLGQLAFAAMESTEFELDLEPLPAGTWAAFGVIPRPSFLLRVPLRQERPDPASKLVRVPLVVQTGLAVNLYGVVLGPGDVPLSGTRVELPALQRVVQADAHGRFFFSTVPAEPHPLLIIRAKGHEQRLSVEQATSHDDPIVIRFDL